MNPPQLHPTPNSPAPTWSNWPKLTKRQKRQGSKWSTSPDSEDTEVAHKHSTSDPPSPSQPKPDLVEPSPTQSVDTTTSEDNGPTATDVMLSCIHLGLLAAQRKARNPGGEKDLPFSPENFEENYDNPWQQHQQILNDAIEYSNPLDSSDDRCPDGRSNSNSDDDTPSDQSLADELQLISKLSKLQIYLLTQQPSHEL